MTEINELTPEIESIVDFVNDTETTMHVLAIHENPHWNNNKQRKQQQEMAHWSCRIQNENRGTVVYFSKGIGIRRWCETLQIADTIPVHTPRDKIGQRYDGPMPPFETEQDKRTFLLCSQPEPPFLIELLDLLARDITLLERVGAYDSWASTVGLSPDSRAAKSSFDLICQQRLNLIALFGEGAYHRLIYETDRLPRAEIVPNPVEKNT